MVRLLLIFLMKINSSFLCSEYHLDFASLFIGGPNDSIITVIKPETPHEILISTFCTYPTNFYSAREVHFQELMFVFSEIRQKPHRKISQKRYFHVRVQSAFTMTASTRTPPFFKPFLPFSYSGPNNLYLIHSSRTI